MHSKAQTFPGQLADKDRVGWSGGYILSDFIQIVKFARQTSRVVEKVGLGRCRFMPRMMEALGRMAGRLMASVWIEEVGVKESCENGKSSNEHSIGYTSIHLITFISQI